MTPELRKMIRDALKAKGKSQAWLGRLLGVDRSQITLMLKEPAKGRRGKKPRSISVQEWQLMATELGLPMRGLGDVTPEGAIGGLQVRGRISGGLWVAEADPLSGIDETRVGAVFNERYPVEDQTAYRIDAPGLPGEVYEVGDYVIAVPFKEYRSKILARDLVVIKETRGDVHRLMLRRAASENGKVVLRPVLSTAVDEPASDGFEVLALVIGFQRYHD